MSTRTDWGWFDKDGKPIAVGDEWHKWVCPQRKWVPAGYVHSFTEEWIDEGLQLEPQCRAESVSVKLERCPKCGMEFRYP